MYARAFRGTRRDTSPIRRKILPLSDVTGKVRGYAEGGKTSVKDDQMPAKRVLIVDDIPDVRSELALLLSLSGDITVAGEASDGREAVLLAEALQPEVILMDLEMLPMDGYEAARQIRLRLPDCRVIALTIHDCEEVRAKCLEAGMEGFLVKGARLETLLQAIRRPVGDQKGETK